MAERQTEDLIDLYSKSYQRTTSRERGTSEQQVAASGVS